MAFSGGHLLLCCFKLISEGYDTAHLTPSDSLMLPFKNLVNDSYSRDTSIKIRSHLDIKRRSGEFIGSFAAYGYRKDPEDKNHLLVDLEAATVVQDIFAWRLAGMSNQGIADKLTGMGILSPMEYKRSKGEKFKSGYKVHAKASWSAVAVRRILTNVVYLGIMEQGQRTTPNYKVRSVVYRPKEEWMRVENTHEAIVTQDDFDLVQRLLLLDTHAPRGQDTVYPLAGLLYCGDCQGTMVKDLSRFGRSYIETGNYLEHILPYLGVRFISINDGYDSISLSSGDVLKAALKNLVNQVYSMDISRKSGSVLREKQKRGEFIGAFASYGYLRDPADPHRMIVDVETAPVVREIYDRRARGDSYNAIARWLNASGTPSPGTYRYRIGIIKDERYAGDGKPWGVETVKLILRSEVYLGHTVQGRRRSEFFAGRPDRYLDPSEWIVVKNTHVPLVSQETFDQVQALGQMKRDAYFANLGKYDSLGAEENLFQGLVFCADCGRPLVRYKEVSHGKKVIYYYICPNYATNLELSGCAYKSLHADELKAAVLSLLKNDIRLAADMERLLKRCRSFQTPRLSKIDRELAQARHTLKRLGEQRESLMRDFVSGALGREDYERVTELHREERERLAEQIKLLETQRAETARLSGQDNPWLNALKGIDAEPELTRKLIRTMVKRIVVYAENRMEIELNYQDERQALIDAAAQYRGEVSA